MSSATRKSPNSASTMAANVSAVPADERKPSVVIDDPESNNASRHESMPNPQKIGVKPAMSPNAHATGNNMSAVIG